MIDPTILDDRARLAFQFASDLAKQLITISTALIAFSVTFTKELVRKGTPTRYLFASLGAQLLSIVGGVWTLMALTGTLMPVGGYAQASAAAFDSNIRLAATFQILLFLAGCAGLVWHGIVAIRHRDADPRALDTVSAESRAGTMAPAATDGERAPDRPPA